MAISCLAKIGIFFYLSFNWFNYAKKSEIIKKIKINYKNKKLKFISEKLFYFCIKDLNNITIKYL